MKRGLVFATLLLVMLIAGSGTASRSAQAASTALVFTVNNSNDIPDVTPGNGVCETALNNHVCTLRGAIQEANAHTGADTINLQANTSYLLTRSGVDDDTALNGDLDITDSVTIVGAGATSTIIDGNGGVTNDRVFHIISGTVSIAGVTIRNGNASSGGGIQNNNGVLTLSNSIVIGNTVGGLNALGGGIYNGGTLTLTNSIVSGNTASGSNAYGGGIFSGITAMVTSSTISGNTAANGGGIYNVIGSIIVINSTISGNYSTVSGGGIYNSSTTSLFNVTITHNRANSDDSGVGIGGGVVNGVSGTFNFINSIIALNENVVLPDPSLNEDDCAGTITSQGYSIVYAVDSDYCIVSGSFTQANPQLGPLQNNGGRTQTHALLPSSPAIDAGNTGGCTDNLSAILTTDQRGFPRPANDGVNGLRCDIGALEYYPHAILLPLIRK